MCMQTEQSASFCEYQENLLHSWITHGSCRLTVNLEGQAAPECGGIVVNRVNPRVFLDNLEFR